MVALIGSLISRRSALGFAWWLSTTARSATASELLSLPPLRDGDRRLYLVRHGETEWNVEHKIQGRTDNPLNSVGRAQANALAEFLSREPIDIVASSNLQRAAATANAVATKHPDARRVVDGRFAEMSFGSLGTPLRLEPTAWSDHTRVLFAQRAP